MQLRNDSFFLLTGGGPRCHVNVGNSRRSAQKKSATRLSGFLYESKMILSQVFI
jgi:hypothetical protein